MLRDMILVVIAAATIFFGLYFEREQAQSKIEALREDIAVVLVGLLSKELDNTMNASLLSSSFEEMEVEVDRLVGLCRHLSKMEPPVLEFKYVNGLINALKAEYVDDDRQEAIRQLGRLKIRTGLEDRKGLARALTFDAYLEFTDPTGYVPKLRKQLELALAKDNNFALAHNLLGVMYVNYANALIDSLRFTEANDLFWSASHKFQAAHDLSPSRTSRYRYLNNRLWVEMLYVNACLKKQVSDSAALYFIEEPSLAQFIMNSRRRILYLESLSRAEANKESKPKSGLLATKAERLCLESFYWAGVRDKKQEQSNLAKARNTFILAICSGLFESLKTEPNGLERAVAQFRRNPLLEQLEVYHGKDVEREITRYFKS
jgi:hypothetical protein